MLSEAFEIRFGCNRLQHHDVLQTDINSMTCKMQAETEQKMAKTSSNLSHRTQGKLQYF